MLDLIIRFLQRMQAQKSAGSSHHRFRKILSIVLGGGVSFLGSMFVLEAGYLDGLISIVIIVGIILLYSGMVWCTYRDKTKPFEFLYLILVPLLMSGVGLILQLSGELDTDLDARVILFLCIGIFPLLHLLDIWVGFSRLRILRWVKNIFLAYNIGYFLLLTLNYLILTFGFHVDWFILFPEIFEEIVGELSDNYRVSFWEVLLVYPMVTLIITFPVFSLLTLYRVPDAKKLLRLGCVFSLIILALNFAPQFLYSFYEGQINKASSILREEGETQVGFQKAQVWLFENAALYMARKGYSYNVNSIFEKIYDSSLAGYFGDRLKDSQQGWTNSFATDASHVGEAAKVLLTLAEIHSETEDGTIRTTYTFDFQNTADVNQEVVVFFQTPSIWSVVSGLKLGLDLELIGQIAPRGAALKVYEESLRRNTDPALIEKVGMSTYSLRVFPILSKTNTLTKGRQKVQVEILTPIMPDEKNIVYVPKFSFMNLRFDKGSRVIAKVYDQKKLAKEEIVPTDVEKYLSQEHMMPTFANSQSMTDIRAYCLPDVLPKSDVLLTLPETKYTDKIALFFDISKSAERSDVQGLYSDIADAFKNKNNVLNDVDFYTFNFDVQRVSDLQNLTFWGYSDTDRIMNYIDKNGFQKQRIVIVTDDDSFNFTSDQNQFPTLQKLYSNKIDIIKIGPKIKRYKTDITNLVATTGGNMFEVLKKENIAGIVKKISAPQTMTISDKNTECIASSGQNNDREKIQAGIVGNILLRQLSQKKSNITDIYTAQNTLAERYKIVNQYNSMIALETEKQQQDLDQYSTQNGAYETEYENFSQPTGQVRGGLAPRLVNSVPTKGIDFGEERLDSGLRSVGSDNYYRSRNFSSELNLTGIFLLLIYLVEILSFIHFLVLVWRKPATEMVTNEEAQK